VYEGLYGSHGGYDIIHGITITRRLRRHRGTETGQNSDTHTISAIWLFYGIVLATKRRKTITFKWTVKLRLYDDWVTGQLKID